MAAKEKEAQEQRRAKAALRKARRAVQRAAQGRRGNKKKRAKKRARQNPLSVRELAEDLNSKWSDDEDAGSPSAFGLDTDDDDEWDSLPGARREGSGLVEEGEEDEDEKDDFETEEARRLWAAAFHFPKGATRPLLRCKRKVNMHKRGGESCVSQVCIALEVRHEASLRPPIALSWPHDSTLVFLLACVIVKPVLRVCSQAPRK